jgi:hypothetical protein
MRVKEAIVYILFNQRPYIVCVFGQQKIQQQNADYLKRSFAQAQREREQVINDLKRLEQSTSKTIV